jgi:hypothetical protein
VRADWRIVVRDVNENRIGQLRHWTQATFIARRNGIGSWAMQIPYDAPGADRIAPGCGILVTRDDRYIISGPLRHYEEQWSEERAQPVLNIAGVSDEYVLKTVVAFPNPNSAITGQTVNATYRLSGVAETVAKTVLQVNMLNTTAAVAERVVPNFALAPDQGRGSSIAISLRFDILLNWLQTAMPPAGLGFKVTYSDADKFLFDVYQPVDRSLDIVFSRGARNMAGYTYSIEAPATTSVYVGGQGVGTARAFLKAQNAPPYSWGYRDELFLDRRDTNDATELAQAGADALFSDGIAPTGFSFTVKDTPQIQFGRDYNLGDKVGYRIRGVTLTDIVNEVAYNLTDATEKVLPRVGDFDNNQLRVYSIVQALARRIGQLERRA